jgi:hypothetical protein
MTGAAPTGTEPPLPWRQIRRRTALFVALLEGAAAATFAVLCAFITTSIAALLLWRIVPRRREFPLTRAMAYGALVIVAGSCLWGWLVDEFGMTGTGTTFVTAASLPPLAFLPVRTLVVVLGILSFGWITVPVGIVIACSVAMWGNVQLRRWPEAQL